MQKLSGLFLFAVLISGVFFSSFAFAEIGPIAQNDFYFVNEDSILTIDPIGVLLNDTNTQSDTFLAIIQTNVGFGTLTLNSDGSLTYQPNQNFDSIDSFTYVANNGTHNSNEATVTLSVNPINDTPISLGDSYTIAEDTSLDIAAPGILDNDSNVDGDTLTSIIDTTTSNGTLTLNSDGSFTYTPNTDFNDSDFFTYHVNDGSLDSNIVIVEITIIPENDAPITQDDHAETHQNVPIRIDVLENDSDTEDDSLNILLTVDSSETKGSVELENSKVLFTPITDFVGETTFSYLVTDGDKISNSALVTVTAIDEPNDESIFDQILGQLELLFDKILNLEDDITLLKEENSALTMRITELESIVGNGISTHDDDSDDKETSKKAIKDQIKALKKDFKAQEKDLKKQLKELKKDKKHHEDED